VHVANLSQGVRQRYKSLGASQAELLNPETAPLGVDEDDDDYEPDFSTAETEEQILNKLDIISPDPEKVNAPDMALGHFTLPQPPPLTLLQATEVGQGTVLRVFGVMQTLEEKIKKTKGGLNRLAASAFDRDAWITILTRLATRTLTGLENTDEAVKPEPSDIEQESLANMIRESLRRYIIEDFRKRIDVAIAWLCEEWYNDKVQIKVSESAVLHYEKWVLKVMDGMVPYLDASDKNVLIRFVSEIPGLSPGVLERLKGLCRNPATVTIALMSLLFLHMQKPPARHMVLTAVEDIWDACRSFPFSQRLPLY
jgi:symplekin